MKANDLVLLKATGESAVLRELEGKTAKILLPTGEATVHIEAIEPAEKSPLDMLMDMPADGQVSSNQDYGLRLQAAYLQHAYKYDPLSGLSNARVEPKLHQVFVAHRVTHKLYPRMILADEVGLGKTIEAGLIIKELRARQIANRVLVLCPAALQQQWKYELESKFNEDFEIIDGHGAKFLGRGGANPWKKRDGVITSLNLAVRPEHAERIVDADWDMVVFDEAHRVRRTRTRTTLAYELADELKEVVDGLLLLSATPMQLDPYELYSLIELIDPGLYPDVATYLGRVSQVPFLNNLMNLLLNWSALSPSEKRSKSNEFLLKPNLFSEDLSLSQDLKDIDSLDNKKVRDKAINEIIEKHPVAEVMVRNRKIQIGEFHTREPHRVPIQLTEAELSLYHDVTEYIRLGYNRALAKKNNAVGFLMTLYQKILTSSSYALFASFKKRVAKLQDDMLARSDTKRDLITAKQFEQMLESDDILDETEHMDGIAIDEEEVKQEISQIRGFINRLEDISDSKAEVMANDIVEQILGKNPDEKILIFTQFIKTQEFLQKILVSMGYEVATFNGQMNLVQKEQEVRRFRHSVPIMITSEAGGEGRNFQFAHIMVNYDLPWNPMKIEQRIGRLDRIGQQYPVQIYNLYNEDTIEENILDVLEKRIDLFTKSVGSLDPILGNVEREISDIVIKNTDDLAIKNYGRNLEEKVNEARLKEEKMADFVLDQASLRKDEASALLNRSPLARFNNLHSFIGDALDYYGGRIVQHIEGGYSLNISRKLATRVKANKLSIRGVFDPEEALVREDLDFFAFGHEIIDKIMSYAYDKGSDVGTRYIPEAETGVSLEVIYAFESSSRMNPIGKMIRHFVGKNLQVVRQDLNSVPIVGESRKIDIPDWLPNAIEASKKQAIKDFAKVRKEVLDQDNQIRELKKKRIERAYKHRRQQLKTLIRKENEWIEQKESFGSEKDKRVIPARRGKLRKRDAELAGLNEKYQSDIEQIDQNVTDVRQIVVCAGLVVGE